MRQQHSTRVHGASRQIDEQIFLVPEPMIENEETKSQADPGGMEICWEKKPNDNGTQRLFQSADGETLTTASSYSSIEDSYVVDESEDIDQEAEGSSPMRLTPSRPRGSPARMSSPRTQKTRSSCTLETVNEKYEDFSKSSKSSKESRSNRKPRADIWRSPLGSEKKVTEASAPGYFALNFSSSDDSSGRTISSTGEAVELSYADDAYQFLSEIEGRSKISSPSIRLEAPRHSHPNYKLMCQRQLERRLKKGKGNIPVYSRHALPMMEMLKTQGSSHSPAGRRHGPRHGTEGFSVLHQHQSVSPPNGIPGNGSAPHSPPMEHYNGAPLDRYGMPAASPLTRKSTYGNIEDSEFLGTPFKPRSVSSILTSPSPTELELRSLQHSSPHSQLRTPSPTIQSPPSIFRRPSRKLRLSRSSKDALDALKKSPDVSMFTSVLDASTNVSSSSSSSDRPPKSKGQAPYPSPALRTKALSDSMKIQSLIGSIERNANAPRARPPKPNQVETHTAQLASSSKLNQIGKTTAHLTPLSFKRTTPVTCQSFLSGLCKESMCNSGGDIMQSIDSFFIDCPDAFATSPVAGWSCQMLPAFESPATAAVQRFGRRTDNTFRVPSRWRVDSTRRSGSTPFPSAKHYGRLFLSMDWVVSTKTDRSSNLMKWSLPSNLSQSDAGEDKTSKSSPAGAVEDDLSPFFYLEGVSEDAWWTHTKENVDDDDDSETAQSDIPVQTEPAICSPGMELMTDCFSVEVCLTYKPTFADEKKTEDAARMIQRSYRKMKDEERRNMHYRLRKLAGQRSRTKRVLNRKRYQPPNQAAAIRVLQRSCRRLIQIRTERGTSKDLVEKKADAEENDRGTENRFILPISTTTICKAIGLNHKILVRPHLYKEKDEERRRAHRHNEQQLRDRLERSATITSVTALRSSIDFLRQEQQRKKEKINATQCRAVGHFAPQLISHDQDGTRTDDSMAGQDDKATKTVDPKPEPNEQPAVPIQTLKRSYMKLLVKKHIELRSRKQAAAVTITRALRYNRLKCARHKQKTPPN